MKEDFHQLVNSLGLPESEGWKQLLKNNEELDAVIGKLDHHLNSVLRKQEYEYLQAYNIYVKRKEKELRELIQALDEKNSNNNFKDLRIQQLEVTIEKMRKDAYEYEKTQEQLKKDIKVWKEKQKVESEEKEFFHK
jgi:predicted RNase H-like nuclease (RuvC/YqgF family)